VYFEGLHEFLSNAFLNKHYGCELRLICRDDQNDKLWDLYEVRYNREDQIFYILENNSMLKFEDLEK